MTITISHTDYDALWQQANPKPQDKGHTDFSDIRRTVPDQLGQGYIRSMQWNGLDLTLYQYQLHEDVQIFGEAQELIGNEYAAFRSGEIGFHLSGNRSGMHTGDNFLEWGYCDNEDDWSFDTYANEPIIKVDLHLSSSCSLSKLVTDTLKKLPTEIHRSLEDDGGKMLYETNIITPAMQVPLKQIFQCPFEGTIKQIYLEGKCLELVALKLDQLKELDKRVDPSCWLSADDVERVHRAKAILIDNLDSPPSLIKLARLVHLNDYKLKIGFRQIFGTTVFGYLYQHRMEVARQLLAKRQMNVKEVAQKVGYASQSRFAAAFRKQFGLNPKAYLLSQKSG